MAGEISEQTSRLIHTAKSDLRGGDPARAQAAASIAIAIELQALREVVATYAVLIAGYEPVMEGVDHG